MSLKQHQSEKCDVRIAMTPVDLLDWIEGYDTLHLCDACRGDAGDGSDRLPAVYRWSWPDEHIAQQGWSGSHDLGLPAVLRLASELGTAPPKIILWGLDARDGDMCDQLVAEAVRRISSEL